MLWKGGATPDDLAEKENRILFQRKLINLQMTLEESCADMAYMSSEPVVIMCDRGCMDGSAYMDSEEWEIMLQRIQKSELEVCAPIWANVEARRSVLMMSKPTHPPRPGRDTQSST